MGRREKTEIADRKLRVVVVGLGYWGLNVLGSLRRRQDVEVVGLVDQSDEAINAARKVVGDAAVFTSLDQALERLSCDAVAITASTAAHVELAEKAISAGRACFVEKPLALSEAAAAGLCELADAKQAVLMVGHVFLFNSACIYIAEQISNRAIGELQHVSFRRANLGPFRYDVSAMWDLAPHDVSMALYWFGSLPTAVSAVESRFHEQTKADMAQILLEFGPRRSASIYVSWVNPLKDRQVVVVGSLRSITWDDTRIEDPVRNYDTRIGLVEHPMEFLQYKLTKYQGDVVIPRFPIESPLDCEIAHFVSCCLSGAACSSDGRHGRDVVKVLEACEQSIQSRQRIVL